MLERADGTRNGTRLRGDIELHLRAADWQAHGHASDSRYNEVILHVALAASGPESPLANGGAAPVVVLRNPVVATDAPSAAWPCAGLLSLLGPVAVQALLVDAGWERFTLRVAALRLELAACSTHGECSPDPRWTTADRVLFVALAEALGYGRDRAALRRAGERLARGDPPAEVLAEAQDGQRVERQRLGGLATLCQRWRERGPWAELSGALQADSSPIAVRSLLARLHVAGGCVSPGRAHIVAANVVLPFAAAYAAERRDPALAARAHAVYAALPGLPSNQITREMRRQLGLPHLPPGAAAQQGLHHVWSQWCRDKRCDGCVCNRRR